LLGRIDMASPPLLLHSGKIRSPIFNVHSRIGRSRLSPDKSDYRKLTRHRYLDPIDRLVPPVLSSLVSPEKNILALGTATEGGFSDASAQVSRTSGAKTRASGGSSPSKLPAQIQPFLRFSRPISFRINTSKTFAIFCIPLISEHLKSTRINTSENKDLKRDYPADAGLC
jgi:hypothetical protein